MAINDIYSMDEYICLLGRTGLRFEDRFVPASRRDPQRPRDQQGPEKVVERRDAALAARLQGAATLRPGETTEEQRWGRPQPFPGRVLAEMGESALATARGWRKSRDALWTEGLRPADNTLSSQILHRRQPASADSRSKVPDQGLGRRASRGPPVQTAERQHHPPRAKRGAQSLS